MPPGSIHPTSIVFGTLRNQPEVRNNNRRTANVAASVRDGEWMDPLRRVCRRAQTIWNTVPPRAQPAAVPNARRWYMPSSSRRSLRRPRRRKSWSCRRRTESNVDDRSGDQRCTATPLLRRIAHHDKRPNTDFQVPSWTSRAGSSRHTPSDSRSDRDRHSAAAEGSQFRTTRGSFGGNFYHSLGRFGDADAALTPTLEGFTPTPTCRKWAADTLPTMLAETDEVNGIIAEAGYRGTQTADGWCDQWP